MQPRRTAAGSALVQLCWVVLLLSVEQDASLPPRAEESLQRLVLVQPCCCLLPASSLSLPTVPSRGQQTAGPAAAAAERVGSVWIRTRPSPLQHSPEPRWVQHWWMPGWPRGHCSLLGETAG
mmetsp:Transcript_834/g.2220  ORF Transcript_834/g.2220 Transcript_834/m.2220 type:complete len:122 (+) Transcript_834:339-704(+)